MNSVKPIIPNPSPDIILNNLKDWESLENYVLQENSLKKLFAATYPLNDDIDDVLIKVCALNDFYSTNILSPFTVAKHIVSLKIDSRLKRDDLTLVNDIATIKMKGDKIINFYSFASKYCSHHKPLVYPIYDSFAEKMLLHFNNEDRFHKFTKKDLKIYSDYKTVILKFIEHHNLTNFNLKEIDKYLWLHGRKHFPKRY